MKKCMLLNNNKLHATELFNYISTIIDEECYLTNFIYNKNPICMEIISTILESLMLMKHNIQGLSIVNKPKILIQIEEIIEHVKSNIEDNVKIKYSKIIHNFISQFSVSCGFIDEYLWCQILPDKSKILTSNSNLKNHVMTQLISYGIENKDHEFITTKNILMKMIKYFPGNLPKDLREIRSKLCNFNENYCELFSNKIFEIIKFKI